MTAGPNSPVLDTEGIFEAVAGLPEQMEAAVAAADAGGAQVRAVGPGTGLRGRPGPEERDGREPWVRQIVVFGMGGSGVAGDILLATAGSVLPVPAMVVK